MQMKNILLLIVHHFSKFQKNDSPAHHDCVRALLL